jgi:rhamnose utilization protein RhaD (predicted bifunctional aldolase and dehydrogenase)
MDQNLEELIGVSRLFGGDPSFVIAGGGNTSFKNEEKIWIKASGISLATIDENGFVSLSRAKLKQISTRRYSQDPLLRESEVKADLHDAIVSPKELRPSVETSLHDLISYRFVVHTHPTKVNAVMCSQKAEETCLELFGEKALFIPYTDPGYILFKRVADAIAGFTEARGYEPRLIFLENHGVFVGADTTTEIESIYTDLMATIETRILCQLPETEKQVLTSEIVDQIGELHPGYKEFKAIGIKSELTNHFVVREEFFQKVSKSFTPDDIVYCKAHYLYLPDQMSDRGDLEKAKELIAAYFEKYGYLPKVLALQNKGIVGVEENLKSAQNVLDVYENILKISFFSENFGGPKFLNDEQIAFIDNWEVENYRRKMAKS